MRVAVLSLRFAPGHVAHLRAYQAMFRALGCEVELFLDPGYRAFMPAELQATYDTSRSVILGWRPELVLSYNIANANIRLASACRHSGIPFYYVLHEPWGSVRDLLEERGRIPRRIAANAVNGLTAAGAAKVILASAHGKEKYERYMRVCNREYDTFPLIFCDDYDASVSVKREYFSFIGGFTQTRACSAFLRFVEYALGEDAQMRFKIATRSDIGSVLHSETLRRAVEEQRLVVAAGRPMRSEEINLHYRQSICVWNAYNNSTQSGVLPNALMQGAPVIVADRGVASEVLTDGVEGCFVSIPHDNGEIMSAYRRIRDNFGAFEANARKTFRDRYLYSAHLARAEEVFGI